MKIIKSISLDRGSINGRLYDYVSFNLSLFHTLGFLWPSIHRIYTCLVRTNIRI